MTVGLPLLAGKSLSTHSLEDVEGTRSLVSQCELLLQLQRSRADLERSTAYIERIAVYRSNGRREAYVVEDWVDLVDGGVRLVVDGTLDDIVGLGLSWPSSVMMRGQGELGAFRLEAKPRRTRLRIREGEGKQPLSPWRVAAGRALGGGPRLTVALTPVEQPMIEGPSRAHGAGDGDALVQRSLERVVLQS